MSRKRQSAINEHNLQGIGLSRRRFLRRLAAGVIAPPLAYAAYRTATAGEDIVVVDGWVLRSSDLDPSTV